MKLKKNDNYIIDIYDIGTQGEGIGKIDDFTVFVPKALPDDKIEIIIVKVKKSYAYGKIIKIIKPSFMRTEPVCSYFGKCGGCSFQHLDYKFQLDFKTKKVKDCIQRIGGFKDIKVNSTIGMDIPFSYRNKAQYPIGKSNNKSIVGFYSQRSHNIIDCGKECYIQHSINSVIIDIIKKFIDYYNISVYDENTGNGIIRHILTRVGYYTNEIMVCIIINSDNLPYYNKLIEKLTKIENMTSIVLNINKEKTNVILGKQIVKLWGKDFIYDYIGDIKFSISPLSFFQINPVQTNILYKIALDAANLKGNETVIDAYCGIGTISLFIAQKAKKVFGIEIIKEAIDDAIKNANINNIKNAEFIVGKSEEIVPILYYEKGIKPDVIFVDPPRKGCDRALLDMLIKINAEKIIYISCDPATLARDLKIICDNSEYKIKLVQPVDLFCMTYHIETVVLLSN